jgi:hypothetical protein
MTRKVWITLICALLLATVLAACGKGSQSSSGSLPVTSVTSTAPAAVTTVATTTPSIGSTASSAAAPGCGVYCQQAGNSAGTGGPPGYPCAATGCQQCPPQNCVALGSTAATASDGIISVPLSCNLNTPCQGAFLLCFVSALCEGGGPGGSGADRLAGSDFVVAPGTTSNVRVALTSLGREAASIPGGYQATVFVDLLDYGPVLNTTSNESGNFALTTTDPPSFPPGTTASCGGLVFVNANTSCPFAENVVQAFWQSSDSTGTVMAVSPVTGQTYEMQCSGGSPYVCTGGTNALVEFYH